MSLMGVVMLAGITMSDSILIVEFARHRMRDGLVVRDAVIDACRVRLRPILMTTLATVVGLLPMAFKLGVGLARDSRIGRDKLIKNASACPFAAGLGVERRCFATIR